MKPFDLQEALNGAPVKLRNGRKAFVMYDLRKYPSLLESTGFKPLNGIVLGDDENDGDRVEWGELGANERLQFDIVGMWEEPELTSEQVLEKSYQENLPVNALGKEVFVIAKTKNGDYVIQEGRDIIYIADLRYKWKFYKDPVPKSDTITVTLPKPFKPKQGDPFYYLTKIEGDFIRVKYAPSFRSDNPFDTGNSSRGNCFRAESDAQAWLDAMKSALGD